jgi:Domain of unknown function (DUF4395)
MRTADPYRDLDVIDARAPRFNQAVVGTLSLATAITGWWGFVAALALQLIVGLRFGRRYCLPCVFYFEVVQPRIGEGELEDSRPPRFANIVGAIFLSAATISYAAGVAVLGTVLASTVAALALLAASTGLCVGCEIYKLVARARGVRPGRADRIDLEELGPVSHEELVVQFTHPLCSGCGSLHEKLSAEGHEVVLVDVSKRRDLATKYHVTLVPFALRVSRDGAVLERIA